MNLAALLETQAAARPDAAAIVVARRGRPQRHSYRELADAVARSATLLRRHGVVAGDRVLVIQPMSYELYVVLLAIFRLGAVAMFLDPSAGRAHIGQCCEIGAPRALVASAKAQLLRLLSPGLRRIPHKFVVGRYAPGAVALRRAAGCEPLAEAVDCAADAPALLTFTSGSTGRPKAALRSQGFLVAQHAALQHALDLQPGEVDLTTLPIFLLANLASGLTSVIPRADLRFPGRIDPVPVLRQIEQLGVVRSAGSPAFYARLAEHCERHDGRLHGLRRIDTGGAPVFPGLLQRLQKLAPAARIVAVYGSTEAEPMAHVAWPEITGADLRAMRGGGGLLAGTPVAEVRLRVLPDRFGEPIGPYTAAQFDAEALPAGAAGEVVVSGDHVLGGYLGGAGDAETKFEVAGRRWHRTGDAGYLDAGGRLWLVGRCGARIDDRKGRLYPFAVECAAQFVAGVRRCAVLGHAGRRVLLVEAQGDLQASEVQAALAWAGLDEVRVVEAIPVDRRHNAKIDYTRIRKLLSEP